MKAAVTAAAVAGSCAVAYLLLGRKRSQSLSDSVSVITNDKGVDSILGVKESKSVANLCAAMIQVDASEMQSDAVAQDVTDVKSDDVFNGNNAIGVTNGDSNLIAVPTEVEEVTKLVQRSTLWSSVVDNEELNAETATMFNGNCETGVLVESSQNADIVSDIETSTNELQRIIAPRSRGDSATADLDQDASWSEKSDHHNCDNLSMGSADSGQGGSEVDVESLFHPHPNMGAAVNYNSNIICYEFEINQTLVGKLIGHHGRNVNNIKYVTSTKIEVVEHKRPRATHKICRITGIRAQVNKALKMIRDTFPLPRFSDLTLEQYQPPKPVQIPVQVNTSAMQMEVAAGVVVEVQVSAVASGCEVWVQQPLHPSFVHLERLHHCMKVNYGTGETSPGLVMPLQENTVCAVLVSGTVDSWCRCQVVGSGEEGVSVLLLDSGGVFVVPVESLRQIRYDYMTLPFQASQCLLCGIEPSSETGEWTESSVSVLMELVAGVLLYATVVSYTPEGVPLVNLYRKDGEEVSRNWAVLPLAVCSNRKSLYMKEN